MRTIEEYNKVIELYNEGNNNCKISRLTGIPRCTVRDWVNGKFNISKNKFKNKYNETNLDCLEYSYILGFYLGDGHIVKFPRSYRLSLFNDKKYEAINQQIEKYLKIIFPYNSINRIDKPGCWQIYMYNSKLLEFFPQHGKGKKHTRKIELLDWQKEIILKYPWEFLEGLIHSDGCIGNYKKMGLQIQFTNLSEDIHRIFKWICSELDIKLRNRTIGYKNSYVKSCSVKYVMEHISLKT